MLGSLLGDWRAFIVSVQAQAMALGVDPSAMPLSHLCYRVATEAEYSLLREALLPFCAEAVENRFNGRPISMLWLAQPLSLADGRECRLIELPSPKASHRYPTGLEHVGFVVSEFADFVARYEAVMDGQKDRGEHCQPQFKSFADGSTVKFYARPLREVVELEGWSFQPV